MHGKSLRATDRLAIVIASVAGAGYSPVVPGTVGSFVALLALWLLPFTPVALLASIVAVSGVGIWAGWRVERLLRTDDPGLVVIDEVAGMLLSVFLLPRTVPVLLSAFVLFRVFDVWKPFPIRQSQALPGGLGIMVDDLLAGLYTLIVMTSARAIFNLV